MSENNPDILIPSLQELIDHLNKWNYYASESIKKSEELLSVVTDCTEDSKIMVKFSENQVMDDSTKVENEKNDIRTLKSKCELEKSKITQLLNSLKSSLELAFATLNYWENELKEATKWVSKATKRLEDAKTSYAAANDLKKRKIAKIELHNSEKDLEKATSCLINCENANNVSLQLTHIAQSTYNPAIEANGLIDRSIIDVTEAENISQRTEGIYGIQKDNLNEVQVLLNNQIALNNEVEIIQNENLRLTNSSQDLVLGSTRDLESRIESLIEFAQPSTVQISASSDISTKSLFKNPVIIAGAILAATLIFGPNALLLTTGALMSLLAVGSCKKHTIKLPDIYESGIFNKTGPKIQEILTKDLEKKLLKVEKNDLNKSKSQKSLDEKLIEDFPLFTPSEQKFIMDKQRLNSQSHNSIIAKKLNNYEIKGTVLSNQNSPYFNKTVNIDYNINPIKSYISPYSSLNEKVRNTAKEIFINQGPFEKYYDPIGKAIDDAANKEFPGHCVLSPNDKYEIKKAMEYEQYQHPSYFMQSMQASLYNNNYDSIKPF